MKRILLLCLVLAFTSCKEKPSETETPKSDISDISTKEFREFKVEDSKYIDVDQFWKPFEEDMKSFSEDDYIHLKPMFFDQDMPTIQKNITSNKLTYEALVKFYLYRIKKYDRANDKSLNSVISLNPNVIEDARAKDKELKNIDVTPNFNYSIYGMPILLKDNINTSGMATTAGAVALKNNYTDDAFIVKQLKAKGAIILGKANLSEWAYFFCGDCPSGYSAIGGQTFNPYGRKTIDTGGSSSGSAVAVAANFCAAAIGSETSGSILSPSSQNSAVGLKPTIGLVSRNGIIPISSTLDTAGPITRNVIDNAILFEAIMSYDAEDSKSIETDWNIIDFEALQNSNLKGKRFATFNRLKKDTLYLNAIKVLRSQGAEIIEIDEEEIDLPDFLRLLNLDMKRDLPVYFKNYGSQELSVATVQDVINFNTKDSLKTAPYGQKLFKGIVADNATEEEFENIKNTLHKNGKTYFDKAFETHQLDGFLSINNYHAGYAAVAEYPALTVPMGFEENGAPKGLTFISYPLQEKQLLEWSYAYEQASKARKSPEKYK
jgi:amidase